MVVPRNCLFWGEGNVRLQFADKIGMVPMIKEYLFKVLGTVSSILPADCANLYFQQVHELPSAMRQHLVLHRDKVVRRQKWKMLVILPPGFFSREV